MKFIIFIIIFCLFFITTDYWCQLSYRECIIYNKRVLLILFIYFNRLSNFKMKCLPWQGLEGKRKLTSVICWGKEKGKMKKKRSEITVEKWKIKKNLMSLLNMWWLQFIFDICRTVVGLWTSFSECFFAKNCIIWWLQFDIKRGYQARCWVVST